jgi:murein DD-endopeptidase MepM/ murein hydrolase activator NlpD
MSAAQRPVPLAKRRPPHRIIIAHGENVRSFTIRPWLIGAIGGVTAVFSVLYLGATGYLVFRDDLLATSIARSARMQHAYEDRIASLRSDIDRLTSRQLLNQESVEAEMDRISGRQAALDARQDSIAALSQAARRAGIEMTDPPAPAAAAADTVPGADAGGDAASDSTADPAPIDPQKTSSIAPVQGSAATLAFLGLRRAAPAEKQDGPDAKLGAVENSIESLARDQVAYVDAIAAKVSNRTEKIAAILKSLGQHVPPSYADSTTDVGGPYVAIDENAAPETFRTNVDLISSEVERFATVRRLAMQLPLTRPIPNSPITSGFGARMDPFLGRPAMHTGIDFRAVSGSLARTTSGGTVISAGYNGGYGNMVEVDHGNGISTRSGHLSRIDVTVGQVVAKGAVIGETGSTGRSTGPHLHYEVRVDGAAVNPMTFIKAGSEIAPLL